ncbi:MAG: HAD-IG family 5'-nucleotidase [Acidimicrobiales bacterium]
MSALPVPPERGIFCNRTLNLRSIQAIGYDMDYTLVHYRTEEWEREAFEHAARNLADRGVPTEELRFDPGATIQGLAFDLELGNLVKASRFGYVVRAQHGTRLLGFGETRDAYQGTFVDLSEDRFEFTNTLFSLSQESLFAQLVDLLDEGRLHASMGYQAVFELVTWALDESHTKGDLKARILADPDRFIERDPDLPPALADQRAAGKKLLLITNSEWPYTRAVMSYAFDPLMADGQTWRDLFDVVICSAAKPHFFSLPSPAYCIEDEDEYLLRPHVGPFTMGCAYVGGNAMAVESTLGVAGGELLYVGDHLFGDVHVSKATLRWRTALILREIEAEIAAASAFREDEARLEELMTRKAGLEAELARTRLERAHQEQDDRSDGDTGGRIETLNRELADLDTEIGPLAHAASTQMNETWGPLLRAGIDKSLFARQVERHADVYTSRVSNFGPVTPYGYLRAPRSNLPHDAIVRSMSVPLDDTVTYDRTGHDDD